MPGGITTRQATKVRIRFRNMLMSLSQRGVVAIVVRIAFVLIGRSTANEVVFSETPVLF